VINNNNNITDNTTKTVRTVYQFLDDGREKRPVLNRRIIMNVKKSVWKRLFGWSRHRWQEDIKTCLKETKRKSMNSTHVAHISIHPCVMLLYK